MKGKSVAETNREVHRPTAREVAIWLLTDVMSNFNLLHSS